jgi:hypothetical protein
MFVLHQFLLISFHRTVFISNKKISKSSYRESVLYIATVGPLPVSTTIGSQMIAGIIEACGKLVAGEIDTWSPASKTDSLTTDFQVFLWYDSRFRTIVFETVNQLVVSITARSFVAIVSGSRDPGDHSVKM